jgi:hypothetical protein
MYDGFANGENVVQLRGVAVFAVQLTDQKIFVFFELFVQGLQI